MTTRFRAVFENGLLRPTTPISLVDGTQVEVVVIQCRQPESPSNPAQILAEIAALPEEASEKDFAGRDHDRILYGEQNSP
jgi:predicted DNA-binding antitoxin AbrB/MazE fold protein